MHKAAKISGKCYHCGDDCGGSLVVSGDKSFCCEGCKVVYSVLNDHGLCAYYTIQNAPGKTIKNAINTSKYDFLDLPEVQEALIDFKTEHYTRAKFFVPDMHCSSCIWLLENLHKLNSHIQASRVDFVRKTVTVAYELEGISLKEVVLLLARIGYEPRLNFSDTETQKPQKTYNKLNIKLGVAGFAFGNIMLFSFPEYLGLDQLSDGAFQSMFGYLNFILSLPVLLYCATEYTKPAINGLFGKRINIDVPITIGIITLFGISTYNIFWLHQPGYFDSFAGLIFFLLLGKVFQEKTYNFLSFERDYKSYFPISVNKVSRNGEETPVLVNDLRKGDQIIIRNGELVPVDAKLNSEEAQVDYSFITGESVPVDVQKEGIVFAGGRLVGRSISLQVKRSFSNSDIVKLWDNDVFTGEKQSRGIENITNHVSKYFTVAILLIASGTLTFWLAFDASVALKSFTSVLIVACPCALALAAPFTFGSVLRVFGRNKLFLRNSAVVEKSSKIDAIVFDKTGTLTENNGQKICYEGIDPGRNERVLIHSLALQSNHPISRHIRNYFPSGTLDYDVVKETPGQGIEGVLNGVSVKIGKWDFVGRPTPEKGTFISIDHNVWGKVSIMESFRKDVLESLKDFKDKDLYVLSGDSNHTAREQLNQWFGNQRLLFDKSPQQKLDFINDLKRAGKTVMMVGDGLNDAGALKASDLGVAVNENVSNFSPACDAILNAEDLGKINRFFRLSNFAMKVIGASFLMSFLYNIIGLGFAVQGMLTPVFSAILMPLSSISVVVFSTLAINVKAKKLKLL